MPICQILRNLLISHVIRGIVIGIAGVFMTVGQLSAQFRNPDYNDLVILSDGDSIRCRVVDVQVGTITVRYTTDDGKIATEIIAKDLCSDVHVGYYSLDDKRRKLPQTNWGQVYDDIKKDSLLTATSDPEGEPRSKRRFRFDIDGGWAYRFGEYVDAGAGRIGSRSGGIIGGDIHYVLRNPRNAVGMKYTFRRFAYRNNGCLRSEENIHYVAISFNHIFGRSRSAFVDVGTGYMNDGMTGNLGGHVGVGIQFHNTEKRVWYIKLSTIIAYVLEGSDGGGGVSWGTPDGSVNLTVGFRFGRLNN